MTEQNDRQQNEVFSKSVRAGKRTYFFDVKTTASGEHYLTITESKRKFNNEDGKFFFEKFKVFLYKEDFHKFHDALTEATDFINQKNEENNFVVNINERNADDDTENVKDSYDSASSSQTDIKFEDL